MFSLLKDICRGMNFLHKSDVQYHGRLKSSNCLVDNRWTCKLTGKHTMKDVDESVRSFFYIGLLIAVDDNEFM